MNQSITVETIVNAPIETVWSAWNEPHHIIRWAFASGDWEALDAENDLQVGGKFKTVMAAKDGSSGFDFTGTYTVVEPSKQIEYDMTLGNLDEVPRHVVIQFTETPTGVRVTETFDPENENSADMQRAGWQAILDNFKHYVESIA